SDGAAGGAGGGNASCGAVEVATCCGGAGGGVGACGTGACAVFGAETGRVTRAVNIGGGVAVATSTPGAGSLVGRNQKFAVSEELSHGVCCPLVAWFTFRRTSLKSCSIWMRGSLETSMKASV